MNELIQIRRDLHQIPEVGMDLPKTRKYVISILDKYNIPYQIIGKYGILAELGNKKGKTFLLRADMDALPMKEESGLDFSCGYNDAAHTCGHDIHTTMLLGAAIQLKEKENEINGCVKFLFQPCEESIQGAKLMIEHNVLEDVDACMAFHVLTTFYPSKTIASISGPITSGSSIFRVDIHAKGGHASAPHKVIDPLKIGIRLYNAMQELVPNELNSQHSNVLAVSNFHSGTVHNVVPNSMFFEGNLRFFNMNDYQHLTKRMIELCEMHSKLYNCEIKFSEITSCPPTINNHELLEFFKKHNQYTYIDMEYPFSFSEDFSYYSSKVPCIFLALNSGNEEEGYIYPLHHPKIIFNEDTIEMGVNSFVTTTLAYLKGD